MTGSPIPRAGALALVALVAAACGTGAASPSGADATADLPSPTPTESSSATGSTAVGGPPPLRMGELPAGQYQTNAFEPSLVLTLPEGWSQYFADEDDEIAFGGPGVDLNITRPPEVVDPATRGAVETPESLLEWFTAHPGLDVGEPVEVQIDGIDSHYVDVAAPSSEVDIFHYPPGNMRLPGGGVARVYIVPLDGPDLVALILAPPNVDDAAAGLDAAQPIVTSLVIND